MCVADTVCQEGFLCPYGRHVTSQRIVCPHVRCVMRKVDGEEAGVLDTLTGVFTEWTSQPAQTEPHEVDEPQELSLRELRRVMEWPPSRGLMK